MSVEIFLGNEAIAWALVEQGCRVVTAYPGTPSSEILSGVVKYKKRLNRQIYTEWSTNEKVAFEVALAAAWSGLRAAVAMKQVGLNVAADPLFSAAYSGVKGGFLIIAADDPDLHSSQTGQDSRLMALNARVPVFDPSSPAEARSMVAQALDLSERYGLPVILRPVTRVCHTVQSLSVDDEPAAGPPLPRTRFRREPARWAATPSFRYSLLAELSAKLNEIAAEFDHSPLNRVIAPSEDTRPGNGDGTSARLGIIASGTACHTAQEALRELGVQVPLLKVGTPYPLPQGVVRDFMGGVETIVVLEEPDACIEWQLPRRKQVRGRLDGLIPAGSELTPERVSAVLAQALEAAGYRVNPPPAVPELQALADSLALPTRPPRLCPGCAHRSAFFAAKSEFGPRAIYPGDIGCYTLGINLRAVDTVLDMGASISIASGFYHTSRLVGDTRPILAAIGDSTFLHAGIPALINAVHSGARFVLLILDNRTTAMTGFQPPATAGTLADGTAAPRKLYIPELVRACGVDFVVETDPYEHETFRTTLRAAYEHSQAADGGVAVVIANRPCVLYDPAPVLQSPRPVVVTEECDGCRYCIEAFECPALVLRPDGSRVDIDEALCIDCGQCVDACYKGFIQWKSS